MGNQLFDQYTLLHFAIGVIAYFWNISFLNTFILHTLFEIAENSNVGMKFINSLSFWPGGKPAPDSLINSVGDTIGVLSGWLIAYALDRIGTERGWYQPHLNI